MFNYRHIKFYGEKVKTIGRGGYGKVNLYKKGKKKYAIKWQPYDVGAIMEIAILRSLNHPNVVKIIDVVPDSDFKKIGLIMNYAGYGTSIKAKKHCMDTINMIYQLLCGVAYIHSKNIEHRDLKPENLLVFNECLLKIADFGTSDALRCARPGKTLESPVGTLWYRPPELLLESKHHTLASDMWSVGCIIYELLTGEPFVQGMDEMGVLFAISKKLGKISTSEWPSVDTLPEYSTYNARIQQYSRKDNLFDDIPDWKDILNELLVYNPKRRKNAYEILLNPIFDGVRKQKLEYPLKGCVENLDFRRPNFPKNKLISNVSKDNDVLAVKDWIFGLRNTLELSRVVISFAFQLLDLVLTKKNIHQSRLYELGGVCIMLASDMREIMTFDVDTIAWVSNSFRLSVAALRDHALRILDFDIILSCPVDYIELYGPLYPPKIQELALEITPFLICLDTKDRYDPKILGFICIILSCMKYRKKILHVNLLTKEQLTLIDKLSENCVLSRWYTKNIEKNFKNRNGISFCDFMQKVTKMDMIM